MQITKSRLKQIIKEEMGRLYEAGGVMTVDQGLEEMAMLLSSEHITDPVRIINGYLEDLRYMAGVDSETPPSSGGSLPPMGDGGMGGMPMSDGMMEGRNKRKK